jgi:hypothetical protein
MADEVMGQGPLFLHPIHRHGNCAADARIDLDDEDFGLMAEENGAPIGGRHEALDGDFDIIGRHGCKM